MQVTEQQIYPTLFEQNRLQSTNKHFFSVLNAERYCKEIPMVNKTLLRKRNIEINLWKYFENQLLSICHTIVNEMFSPNFELLSIWSEALPEVNLRFQAKEFWIPLYISVIKKKKTWMTTISNGYNILSRLIVFTRLEEIPPIGFRERRYQGIIYLKFMHAMIPIFHNEALKEWSLFTNLPAKVIFLRP